jgi:sec-independent protein translocase protein TatA
MFTIPLFLSDVGGSEILLILVVILIFFGSSSIPGIAKTMGKTIHQIKQASQEVQNEIKKSAGDMKTDFDLQKVMRETIDVVEKPIVQEAIKMDQIIDSPSEHSHPFIVRKNNPAQIEQAAVEGEDSAVDVEGKEVPAENAVKTNEA